MLLVNEDYKLALSLALSKARYKVRIYSAFIKRDGLEYLSKAVSDEVLDVEVVARWQKQDLLVGASDLDVYEFCQEQGWRFGVHPTIHAKLTIIDDQSAFLGSANVTSRGLNIQCAGNFEVGTALEVDSLDLDRVKKMESEVTWIDRELFDQIENDLKNCPATDIATDTHTRWSFELYKALGSAVGDLWIMDLPFGFPSLIFEGTESALHDRAMFCIPLNATEMEIGEAFRQSEIYQYLLALLDESDDINFGKLSFIIHSAVIDDPKPYRKAIKELVSNLYAWCDAHGSDVLILKHRHTRSMRRKDIT
jgi:hypothetical protein